MADRGEKSPLDFRRGLWTKTTMPKVQTCRKSIAAWRKGTPMNYGNMMSYVLSAVQVVIAVVYATQGQGWKAANFLAGALAIFSVTRMH